MIGHLAVPALNEGKNTSATLSKPIIETLLRKQLGYEGLVISDALNMHSVSKLYAKKGELEWEAFNAGNDVLCFAENVAEGIQEILKNASPERIQASFDRLWKCKQKAGIINGDNVFPSFSTIDFDYKATTELNRKIAQNCITLLKDTNNTKAVFDAKANNTLAKLSIYKSTDNAFFKALSSNLSSPEFSIEMGNNSSISEIEKNLGNFETIIISLFVPKAKPLNKFDIEESVLQLLGQLLTSKKCILYVFGNPYALQLIPNLESAAGIIEMYQDFNEFQESAAEQLQKNTSCEGKLPVVINNL
jgi:hypothetical protein